MAAPVHQYDVLIIGAGAAGLAAALSLPQGMRVALLCKGTPEESASHRAQGGIAAVLDKGDSVDAHIADTMAVGAGLCRKEAVRFLVERGPDCIAWLESLGMAFTRGERQTLHLGREGGHSRRRVIHRDDATGRSLVATLMERVRERSHIHCFSDYLAADLIRADNLCQGAYAMHLPSRQVEQFAARFTLLATGGCARVYLYSTAPPGSSGDGIAMAWRAGCRVANMEFNQFHPTVLYWPGEDSFLISEAVRGEGGKLLLPDGSHFMHRFDSREELAPRDVVARAIDHEMKRLGIDCVFLDISHRGRDFVEKHFPTINAHCRALGLDISQDRIPVVPAAHYTCGGVVTGHHAETDLSGLYAAGETASTGVHGANRLASNSLLECLVYGRAAAAHMTRQSDQSLPLAPAPDWDESRVIESDEDIVVSHNWDELRHFMWDYVGIVRTRRRLLRARRRLQLMQREVSEYYTRYRVSRDLLELRNLALAAELIVRSALARKESRGLHFTLDFPDTLPRARDTVLRPPNSVV